MRPVTRTFLTYSIGALAMLAVGTANAAEIKRGTISGIPIIYLSKRINNGDDKLFRNIARGMDRAVVLLNSPGGNLHASIGIGKTIRDRGFDTGVANVCVSGCALAWLGGRKRMVRREALVGFHGAYSERNGRSNFPA